MGSAAMIAAAAAAQAARRKRLEEQEAAVEESAPAWEAIATKFTLRTTTTSDDGPALVGSIGGVECAIGLVFDGDGWAHTRVTATPLAAAPCEVSIYPSPHGIFDTLRGWLGPKDVQIGDKPFDDAFLIHAEPAELAASVLDPEVRPILKAFLGHALEAFTYNPAGVALQWGGVESDPVFLEAALTIVLKVARWHPPGPEPFRDPG